VTRLLVVRSVSFQQLDASLEAVRARFPSHAIDVLTHEHGRELAASYRTVDSVIVYPEPGPFTRGAWRPPPGVTWDVVVVPVANLTGAGFANVFDFARPLGPSVYRCNLAGDIVELPAAELDRVRRRDRVNRVAAAVVGPLVGALAAAAFAIAVGLARLGGAGGR
jgi:hypothetical protein